MAKKRATKRTPAKRPRKTEPSPEEKFIAEIDMFATLLRDEHQKILGLEKELAFAKVAYEEAKAKVREAKDREHQTVGLLLRFIKPGSIDILPLFDNMEKSDDAVHGVGSTEWRKEPIASISMSAVALKALVDNDVVLVGQLQDRVTGKPDDWWAGLNGISDGMAEAIAAKLYAFVEERSKQ